MANDSRDHCLSFHRLKTVLFLCTAMTMLVMSGGCTTVHKQVAQALGSGKAAPVVRETTVEESYKIACPDIVEIKIAGGVSGQFCVNAEGRIDLPPLGNPRIEGDTVATLSSRLATEFAVAPEQVKCKVIHFRSRFIYVHGPIEGGDRAVPYRGTENTISFIRRCGGLKTGADLRDIHIVRGNVALGIQPQVFTVDLQGILLRGEPQTNVLLQPFDELHVGELPRSKIGRALPHWLRPVYRGLCSVFPSLCPQDWREQIRDQEP